MLQIIAVKILYMLKLIITLLLLEWALLRHFVNFYKKMILPLLCELQMVIGWALSFKTMVLGIIKSTMVDGVAISMK